MDKNIRKWDFFERKEFRCKCCGVNLIKEELIDKLDKARKLVGVPFIITSGYRCEKHNKEVGGHPRSYHKIGWAADIAVNNKNRFIILDALMRTGFTHIGVGEHLIHCDLSQKVKLWVYPNGNKS